MPHYFIDTSDGHDTIIDDEGLALPDDAAAPRMAQTALADMVRDYVPDGDSRRFSCFVRDAQKAALYSATLTLDGGWAEEATEQGKAGLGQ